MTTYDYESDVALDALADVKDSVAGKIDFLVDSVMPGYIKSPLRQRQPTQASGPGNV